MPPYIASSASQINSFGDCETFWHNASVLKLPVPPTDYTLGGEAVHAELEDYSAKGTEITHPSALKAMVWLAPPMTPGVVVEAWLEKPNLYMSGLHIRGRVDYYDTRDPKHPRILDFKSKKKWDRYMKTPRTLLKDTQVTIYSAHALARFPEAEAVDVGHIYLIRDREAPDAKLVEATLTRERVQENIAALEPTLERMKQVADGTIVPERNHSRCDFFYGRTCPFKDRCFPATTERFATLFSDFTPPPATESEETMTLLSKLTATKDETPSIPLPETFIGTVSKTEAPAPGPTTATAAGLTLYVDCLPEKFGGTYLILADEIARRAEIIMREAGVKTLHEKPLDFGKGKAKLEDSFRLAPLTGTVFATSGGMSTGVIEVLVPLASTVVRGVR